MNYKNNLMTSFLWVSCYQQFSVSRLPLFYIISSEGHKRRNKKIAISHTFFSCLHNPRPEHTIVKGREVVRCEAHIHTLTTMGNAITAIISYMLCIFFVMCSSDDDKRELWEKFKKYKKYWWGGSWIKNSTVLPHNFLLLAFSSLLFLSNNLTLFGRTSLFVFLFSDCERKEWGKK